MEINNFYGNADFGLEVIGACTFADMGFLVTVRTIRLNPEALNQRLIAEIGENTAACVAWEQKVYHLLGAPIDHDHSAYVAHVLAEICTVVTMERAGGTS